MTKCVDDKFEILVTGLSVFSLAFEIVTNIRSPLSAL